MTFESLFESTEPERWATGFGFTEGPLWHPEGFFTFVDIRASALSIMDCWVKALQSDPGVDGRKAPVDACAGRVAGPLPREDLGLQAGPIGNAAIEALARQRTQFDLRDIQPASVFRGVMDLELLG